MDRLPSPIILQIGGYLDRLRDIGAWRCSGRRYYILLGNIAKKFTYIRVDDEYCGLDSDDEDEIESRLFLSGNMKLEVILPRDYTTLYITPSAIGKPNVETLGTQMWGGMFNMMNRKMYMLTYRHHMGFELYLSKEQELEVVKQVKRFYEIEHPDLCEFVK